MLLTLPFAVSGVYVFRRFLSSRKAAAAAAVFLVIAAAVAGIVKSLRVPRSDKRPLVAAVAAALRAAQKIYDYLVERGIIVRNRSRIQLCDNCLRITIGTRSENNELLAALRQY